MKLPVEWITEYAPVKASTEEIAERLTMAGLEVEATEASQSGDVLDIKVTPNRGDCLSVVGVARELAAAYGIPTKDAPQAVSSDSGGIGDSVSVSIDAPEDCPRYSARIIRNVRSLASPAWMQERLTAAGMRPIGGIVDITNYVMLEMGQPIHAFDLDTLRGSEIVVRRAKPGETLTTLDGVKRELTADMLMICDAERVVAVAGVMGGAETEIGGSTKSVLLESAHFNPLVVRRASRLLGLRTEASYRFERYVDPAGAVAASDRACQLIAELGMGEPLHGVVDAHPLPPESRAIRLRTDRASMLLGFPVTQAQVEKSLTGLGFGLEPLDYGDCSVTIPSWRPDIVREEDLVEEVGRVVGYEHIPEKLPTGASTQGGDSEYGRFTAKLREALTGAGLFEVVSHSLLAPSAFEDPRAADRRVPIRSALSAELSGLRRSLIPGLIDALERNARRGQAPLAFFEIGKLFHAESAGVTEAAALGVAMAGPIEDATWHKGRRPADFYFARGIVEQVAESLRIPAVRFQQCEDPRLHPGRSADVILGDEVVGRMGEMHPDLARELTTRERVIVVEVELTPLLNATLEGRGFRPLTPYPAVSRDIAPRVASGLPFAAVQSAVDSVRLEILERMSLTDVYSGPPLPEGVKSFTLNFTFRSPESTLTEEQVNQALAQIRSALETSCGATFLA
jgi:phenylalanyl-tRNA synthetase beta chain